MNSKVQWHLGSLFGLVCLSHNALSEIFFHIFLTIQVFCLFTIVSDFALLQDFCVCQCDGISNYMYVLYFSFNSFLFCSFVSFFFAILVCSNFIINFLLFWMSVCLLMRKTKKGCRFGWVGRCG